MSEQNNSRAAVREVLAAEHPAWLERAHWACQREGFGWIPLGD
jgi:hypothetical protein